jgi:hypothetical protein
MQEKIIIQMGHGKKLLISLFANHIKIWAYVKNPKKLDFWMIFDIKRRLKIHLFWIFGVGYGWMFNHPSNPKSRKKIDFLSQYWSAFSQSRDFSKKKKICL